MQQADSEPITRKEVEAEVERLIALLDGLDGDPELEEDDPAEEGGDVEPSLGWTLSTDQTAPTFSRGVEDDLEDEHDGREPDVDDELGGDDEPLLGSYDRMIDQTLSYQTPRGGWSTGHEACAPIDAKRHAAATERRGKAKPAIGIRVTQVLTYGPEAVLALRGPDGKDYRIRSVR